MRDIRGHRISIIFQEPATSLNPVMTVGRQITEVIERHTPLRGAAARAQGDRMAEARRHSGAGAPGRRLSVPDVRRTEAARDDRDRARGGARHRDRRRADDRARRHDPGADPRPAARAPVGAEDGDAADHARPRDRRQDGPSRRVDVRRARSSKSPTRRSSSRARCTRTRSTCSKRCRIPASAAAGSRRSRGSVPPLNQEFAGCRFADRCGNVMERCRSTPPLLREFSPGHSVRCLLYDGVGRRGAGEAHPGQGSRAAGRSAAGQTSCWTCRTIGSGFPIRKGLLKRTVGLREGGRRRVVHHPRRTHAGARRRIGQRQDHRRQGGAAAPARRRENQRLREARRTGDGTLERRGVAHRAPRRADRVPGPVRVAQSANARQRNPRGRRGVAAPRCHRRGAHRARRPCCSRRSACGATP